VALRLVLAALAAAGAAPLSAQPKSDWELAEEERNWQEGEYALPRYPQAADLVEFRVTVATDFRFFIDRSSLSVGKDGVVRYVLVARSGSGVENVSFDGIRCKPAMMRTYAYGQGGDRWSVRGTAWRPIEPNSTPRWHSVLWREYFCPNAIAIRNPTEGLEALRRGAHPDRPRLDTILR
jgi:hypothetical protein